MSQVSSNRITNHAHFGLEPSRAGLQAGDVPPPKSTPGQTALMAVRFFLTVRGALNSRERL